jgi:hypothetical protein
MKSNRYQFVAGILALLSAAQVINKPLNQSVIFLKECDDALTSDTWNVVVHFNLTPYDQAIATLHEDLKGIYDVARHSWQFDEVQRVQTVLDSLEGKLTNLKQFLPKPGKNRDWINLGGRLLQVLFSSATTADLDGLHSTVDSLSKNQELISHSLNQQVSLFKQLDGIVRHNQETISNQPAIVKDYVIKVQDKFQNTVSRLEWLTKQQQVNTAVRSSEFSVMQLEGQIDELVNAFQTQGE